MSRQHTHSLHYSFGDGHVASCHSTFIQGGMSLLALFQSRVAKEPNSPPTNVSKRRLRKKSLVRLSEPNSEKTHNLSPSMGNHVSFESSPRSSRPPRTSTIPELPCLPIYETLTLSMGTSKVSDNGNTELSSAKAREHLRPLSKCTPQNTSRVHIVPQERTATFKLVPTINPASNPQLTPKTPIHDRASILAESYRSILPDFDDLEQFNNGFENKIVLKKRPSELDLKRPHMSLNQPHTSESIYRQSTVAKQVIVEIPSSPQHQSFIAQIDSVIAPLSAASSITAVDNSERSSEEQYAPPVIPPQAPQRKYQAINHSRVFPQSSSIASSSNPATPQSPKPPSSRFKIPKGENSKSSLALQICANMLTDELKKALFTKRDGVDENSQAAKLQVLLLIEAYEAVMDSCREQLAQTEHDDSNVEVKHTKEAMEILAHWLDSLYEIYGEAFGHEDDNDARC